MIIPKKIQLHGITINIELDKTLAQDEDCWGMAMYRENKIKLFPRKRDLMEVTYLHELVHYILDQLEYSDLNSDEKFVNLFAKLLYQALESGKGEIK